MNRNLYTGAAITTGGARDMEFAATPVLYLLKGYIGLFLTMLLCLVAMRAKMKSPPGEEPFIPLVGGGILKPFCRPGIAANKRSRQGYKTYDLDLWAQISGICLPHNLTHHRKNPGGINGVDTMLK